MIEYITSTPIKQPASKNSFKIEIEICEDCGCEIGGDIGCQCHCTCKKPWHDCTCEPPEPEG